MPRVSLTGTRIRERRLAMGLRQADVARRVAVSSSYLNLIEHNRRPVGATLLTSLAGVLGVPAAALTEGAEAALVTGLRDAAARPQARNRREPARAVGVHGTVSSVLRAPEKRAACS